MIFAWGDRHIGRKIKHSAWLASPTPQTANRHRWFGCRCGGRGGRKVSSLARGIPPNPSQLSSVTSHFWKHCRLGVFFRTISLPSLPVLTQFSWRSWDHSLEPVLQLQDLWCTLGLGNHPPFSPTSLQCHSKMCCGAEKTQPAGYNDIYNLHFSKRCSTAISQGSFPQPLISEQSRKLIFKLNVQNDHHKLRVSSQDVFYFPSLISTRTVLPGWDR